MPDDGSSQGDPYLRLEEVAGKEAKVLIELWRRHYHAVCPHGSLGYRPTAPETIITPSWPHGSAALRRTASLAEKSPMHQHSGWTSQRGAGQSGLAGADSAK